MKLHLEVPKTSHSISITWDTLAYNQEAKPLEASQIISLAMMHPLRTKMNQKRPMYPKASPLCKVHKWYGYYLD